MKKKGLRIVLSILLILTLLPFTACSDNSSQATGKVTNAPTVTAAAAADAVTASAKAAAPTVKPTVGPAAGAAGFYVDGTKLYDANGNEFIMRGVNQAYTWYKGYNNIALDAIAKTGANTVRLVLADGQQWTMDYMLYVRQLIKECKKRNLIAVLEVHDATGKNSVDDLNKAVDYWISIKDALIGEEKYVIINIANEWYGNWGGKEWANAYIAAIPKLREAGLSHTILVDSSGWGQYAKSVHDFGTKIFNADPIKNTMFAIHMYGTAGKNADTIKSNIDGVRDLNLCVTIGEFGYKHIDGDVDEAYLMEYCQKVGVGYLGWSWKGNGGGVEYLDIATEWDGSKLSSDWGEILINGKNGIRETSKICSVFK